MKKYLPSLFFFLCISVLSIAQPLSVKLLPRAIESFPALQSFAWAEFDSNIFFLGGRIDGLHRRQPFAAFDAAGRPQSVWMLNEADNTVVSRNLDELPASLREQLQSTNMEFIQNDSLLYLFGGYGYSDQAQDHITFPYLTKVNLPLLLNALNNNIPLNSAFSQVSDERLAITGGRAGKIGNRYFIYGGHRFEGRYNPMNGPSFVQTYSNALRSFEIQQNGPIPELTDYSEQIDTAKFHRRDFNLVPQIFPGGNYAYTAYSGVFRTDFDLPFTNAITTTIGESYEEQGFNQYLNHYHCAVVPVFLNDNDAMHNVFFGGMAQYFPDTNGTLAQDNSIPFVSTIADVTRNGAGVLSETALEISMNGLKGAGAEFIPNPNLTRTLHGVIVLSSLPKDSLLLGWIVGGIEADLPSIFWINDGNQSRAENRIMEVWLQGNMPATVIPISNEAELRAFPCPMNDHVFVTMQLNRESDVELLIRNTAGKKVYRKYLKNEPAGEFKHTIKIDNALNAGIYILEIATYDGIHKMKLIVSE
jgi:hypothetical protein